MTKTVNIGGVKIGGGNKIAVQSMANVKTEKISEVCEQINALKAAGCDIVRLAVKDDADANAIAEIKKRVKVPIVADVHFDYKLAVKAIESGVDKVRINPGNIGSVENVKKVADALKAHHIPVRVGSNGGSVEKEFLQKYGKNEISLAESALKNVYALEKCGVTDIVISAKASSVPLTVKTYRYLAKKTDYPLHIGVTEAGTYNSGIIKSAVGIGALLLDGIGDTVRVSLAASPLKEPLAAIKILRAAGIYKDYAEVITCPTCGRTEYDSIGLAERVEELTAGIKTPLKIAVMGCVVNGVGEAADADVGIAGSKNYCVIFKKNEIIKKVPFNLAEEEFLKEIKKIANEVR